MVTVKRFFVNAAGEKKFVDIILDLPDSTIEEEVTAAVCAKYPTDLGAYCIDMSSQVIKHKYHWDSAAVPPAAVKDW